MRKAFTLIELLIVVAIIAILAAVAVPNFLEAQVRAKVSRVKNDLRSVATAVESYRVDNNRYPTSGDHPSVYDQKIADYLIPLNLDRGYYGFRTQGSGGRIAGQDFATITTPIAYISNLPTDPFTGPASTFFQYCYRTTSGSGHGYVLTSVGPDSDLLSDEGGGPGKGTRNPNVIGTFADTKSPCARLGDINEHGVTSLIENKPRPPATTEDVPRLRQLLEDLSYDPTNGTVSDGDIVRIGP